MTTTTDAPSLDVLTVGRIGVDMYPLQDGVGLGDVETFGKYLGGSATNVAIAAARHDLRSAVITAVGDDPLADGDVTQAVDMAAALVHGGVTRG